jgi:hypothetical protein
VDFNELWAPVSAYTTLRCLLAVVAVRDLVLDKLDVKPAFLNGELKEDIFMRQPPRHYQGGPELVCNLKKALYGLKQASRAWHLTLKRHLEQQGFSASRADPPSLYILPRDAGRTVYLPVYVDDLLIAAQLPEDVATVKTRLLGAFDARDLGPSDFFLGLLIKRDRQQKTLWLGHERYANELVERFGM